MKSKEKSMKKMDTKITNNHMKESRQETDKNIQEAIMVNCTNFKQKNCENGRRKRGKGTGERE